MGAVEHVGQQAMGELRHLLNLLGTAEAADPTGAPPSPQPGLGQLEALLTRVSAAHLANAVRLVTTGDALLAPVITRRLVERYARRDSAHATVHRGMATLTPRELEILKLIARGLNNRELAEQLRLSEATVKTHVTHILTKLGLRDRIQAVVLACETGLVAPAGPAGEPSQDR